jgi:hypothetical protein
MCEVYNWNNSINNITEQLGDAVLNGRTAAALEVANEIKRWTARRDRQLASLRRITATFTAEDIAFIRRRAPQLEGELQALDAIELPWTASIQANWNRGRRWRRAAPHILPPGQSA